MMVFRINGFGVWFLGVTSPDKDGTCFATKWITAMFLPILPLGRYKILPTKERKNDFNYRVIEKSRLKFTEIIKTYFSGLILMPIFLLWPIAIVIPEVSAEVFHLPFYAQMTLTGFAIIWIIFAIWKLKDWDVQRWFKASKM